MSFIHQHLRTLHTLVPHDEWDTAGMRRFWYIPHANALNCTHVFRACLVEFSTKYRTMPTIYALHIYMYGYKRMQTLRAYWIYFFDLWYKYKYKDFSKLHNTYICICSCLYAYIHLCVSWVFFPLMYICQKLMNHTNVCMHTDMRRCNCMCCVIN